MKKIKVLGFAVTILLIVLSSCATANKYMEVGTNEYTNVTEKVVGAWTITEFIKSNKPVFGDTFESAQLTLEPETWISTITLSLNKDLILSKLKESKKDYPDLNIDEYNIVSISRWNVDNKGETIFFSEKESMLDIKGSGENFMGFYGFEQTKFEMAKTAKTADYGGGGLANLAAQSLIGAATAKATATEDYFIQPDYTFGYWIKDLSPNGFILDNKKGGKFTVKK